MICAIHICSPVNQVKNRLFMVGHGNKSSKIGLFAVGFRRTLTRRTACITSGSQIPRLNIFSAWKIKYRWQRITLPQKRQPQGTSGRIMIDGKPAEEENDGEATMKQPKSISRYRRKKRLRERNICACCRKRVPFCWTCRCGFQICQACMLENFWGMSCNGITWECPDCGAQNGLGNQ